MPRDEQMWDYTHHMIRLYRYKVVRAISYPQNPLCSSVRRDCAGGWMNPKPPLVRPYAS